MSNEERFAHQKKVTPEAQESSTEREPEVRQDKVPDQISPETLHKQESEKVFDSVARLVTALYTREEDRLPPLMDERAFMRLRGASSAITDPASSLEALEATANALHEYGNVQRGSTVQEDPESLRRISFALRELAESAQNAALRIGARDQNMPAYAAFKNLATSAGDAFETHLRRVHAIEDY